MDKPPYLVDKVCYRAVTSFGRVTSFSYTFCAFSLATARFRAPVDNPVTYSGDIHRGVVIATHIGGCIAQNRSWSVSGHV